MLNQYSSLFSWYLTKEVEIKWSFSICFICSKKTEKTAERICPGPWTNICFNEVSSSAPLLVCLGGEFRYSLELVKIRFAEIQLHPN